DDRVTAAAHRDPSLLLLSSDPVPATMVTAGVYLIARTHGLFLMTPEVLHLVGIVGAVTLLLAGFAALVQTDIKRVLAYSTMSQIGYMFLALGV
ncbi:proton-conducting transporter membrane subunit, partial [Pseudomonas aeruginosa]|uniref:proton-conducting transporter transmembrane domain-containing protein n=1 Tax=Pseudomonas aeruginosa TaxID=287 RepID=UPI0031B6DE68